LKTGVRAPLVQVEPPQPQSPIEARNFVADSGLFTRLTGWRPRVGLIDGIDRTIEAIA
jgi:nucleoside-diphosphate-sugar epimerase